MPDTETPKGDIDLVMRFRKVFADTLEQLPCDQFENAREMRSTAVTMFLRAAVEELIAHVGTNQKAITYAMSQEIGRAIADRVERDSNPRKVM